MHILMSFTHDGYSHYSSCAHVRPLSSLPPSLSEYNQLSSRRTQQELIRFEQAAPMLRALTTGF